MATFEITLSEKSVEGWTLKVNETNTQLDSVNLMPKTFEEVLQETMENIGIQAYRAQIKSGMGTLTQQLLMAPENVVEEVRLLLKPKAKPQE